MSGVVAFRRRGGSGASSLGGGGVSQLIRRCVGPAKGATLEYTDQQRAAFRDAYTRRLRKQLVMLVLLFAAMAALAFTEDGATFLGLSGAVFGPISLVAIVVAWVIFAGRNWRCPACGKYLGREFNPKRCRSCGIELRG